MLNNYHLELDNYINKLNHLYKEKFNKISFQTLMVIHMPNSTTAYYLLNKEGLKKLKEKTQCENQIEINYSDLLRLTQNPSKVIRYLFQNKIKIKGSPSFLRDLIEILKIF